jgi:hypothetical protein
MLCLGKGNWPKVRGKLGLALQAVCTVCVLLPSVGHTATANVPVSAVILPPVTLLEPAEMRFGTLASGPTAGTLTLTLPTGLDPSPPTTSSPIISGTRTRTGGVVMLGGGTCSATVNCGAGSVQVTGPASGTFSTVTFPASITITSGANTMTVGTFNKRYGEAGTAGVTTGAGAFSAFGVAVVVFTGRLTVGASQAAGTYTGTLVVTVDY